MGVYQNNVIVLRSRNLGEADRILVLLGEDSGKFEAVVKGARRQRSRFVGNTLPFNYLKAQFFPGKGLDSLSQAELIHPFVKLREDLVKLAYASYWVEMVDGFLPEKAEAKEVFRFLLAAFVVLEQTVDPILLNMAFETRLLNYLGYQPQLNCCVGCGSVAEQISFSAIAGGVICRECGPQHRDLIALSPDDLNLLTSLAKTDIRELSVLGFDRSRLSNVQRILRNFIEARLEKPLKSKAFLDEVLS